MGTGFRLFHIGLRKKIQGKLLFMVLKTYIFEMKFQSGDNPGTELLLLRYKGVLKSAQPLYQFSTHCSFRPQTVTA